jgi:putative transposase
MSYRLIHELAAEGFPVAVICRYLRVSRSRYYDWLERAPSAREVADKQLIATITKFHAMSRYSYGTPRVHAELRLGLGVRCGRKRVARLMRTAGIAGICHRRKPGGHQPLLACHDDLVGRRFLADRPNTLWVTDITEHSTSEGTVCCCAVLDVYSRMIVGWSIADHRSTDLVVDALQMACWRRRPSPGTICHSDRGAQYTSWAFGHRAAPSWTPGLDGPGGLIGGQHHDRIVLVDSAT